MTACLELLNISKHCTILGNFINYLVKSNLYFQCVFYNLTYNEIHRQYIMNIVKHNEYTLFKSLKCTPLII